MPVSGQCTIIVRREPVTSWMGTSEGRGHQSKGHVVRRRWWLPVHNMSKVTCPLINYKGFNEARAIKLDIKKIPDTIYVLSFIAAMFFVR